MPAPFGLTGLAGSAVLCAFTLSASSTAQAEVAAPLTLEAAITAAVEFSPRVREAQAAADSAAASARAAGAPVGPVLNVTPLYSDARQLDLEAELSWTLFDPTLGPAGRAARAALAEALLAVEEARVEVAADARQTYFRLAGAEAQVAAQQQDLELARVLRDAAARARDIGERPGIDVLRADLELGQSEQELAEVEAAVAAAWIDLNSLLGRDPDARFGLVPPVLPAEPPARATLLERLAARPGLRAAALAVEQRRRLVELARSQRAPSVDVAGFREDEEHGIRVSVNLPIFDLGRVRGEVATAEAAVKEAEGALAVAQRAATLAVDQASLALATALARREGFSRNVLSRAERLAELARLGYESGETSILEVLDARRQLAAARRESVALTLAVSEAWTALERAAGGPLPIPAVAAAPMVRPADRRISLGPPAPEAATAPSRLAGDDR